MNRVTLLLDAGFRTLLLVGMAACLFVVAGEAAALTYPATTASLRVEPFALIQAVGLTTAASIWATAAVGLTAGFGRYLLAAGTTILMLITLRLLMRFDNSHPHDWTRTEVAPIK